MKNSPGGHGDFALTFPAMQIASGGYPGLFYRSAAATNKSIRPPTLSEVAAAGLLTIKPIKELLIGFRIINACNWMDVFHAQNLYAGGTCVNLIPRSRKIVGFHAGDTLETEGCLNALEKAVNELEEGRIPLHHSDRGSQYCSHVYTGRLREHGLGISMTEENHCYENAKAERVNGILKQEYGLGSTFLTKQQAVASVDQAVMLYNTRRPHLALKYKTPEEVHKELKKAA